VITTSLPPAADAGGENSIQLVFEGKEVSFVVVPTDDRAAEFQETRVAFRMTTGPLLQEASRHRQEKEEGGAKDDKRHTCYPFEITVPKHFPASVTFQGRKGDKCSLEYSLQARRLTTTAVSVAERIQVLWAAPDDAACSRRDAELVLKVGARVPLTKSYFCGLWQAAPVSTYTLVPSPESLVLCPNQSLRVHLPQQRDDDDDDKNADEGPERFSLWCHPVQVKLTQKISWSAWGRTTDITSTVRQQMMGNGGDAAIRIPPRMSPSYRGRLLRVHHEMLLYVMDGDRQRQQQVVATTPVLPVQIVPQGA
jgi:hypothetical protein